MTIHIPKELESSLEAAVHSGHFTSLDAAMAEAARLLLRELKQKPSPVQIPGLPSNPLLGLMRDDADTMDEITADAYRQRRQPSWRVLDVE